MLTPEELQAKLEKAAQNYLAIKTKNDELETKARKGEKDIEALTLQLKELIDKGVKAEKVTELVTKLDELSDELSDVRSEIKSPATAFDTKELKGLQENVVMKSVGKFLKSKDKGADFFKFVNEDAVEQCKTLNISTPADGGLAIAETLARDVLDYYREMSPILQYVGRKPSMTRNYRQLIMNSYPSVAEGIENVPGTAPAETSTQTYTEVKSQVFKLYAQPRITNEALYGADIDVYSDLVQALGEQIGIYLAAQVLYGDGSDKNARGILSSKRIDITDTTGESFKKTLGTGARGADFYPVYPTGVSGDLGADDVARTDFILDFMRKLPNRYRAAAKLYMNENTLGVIEKIRDANELPIFRTSYRDGVPMINGKPYVIDDTLPDIAANSTFMMYGDLAKAYVINDGDIDQLLLDPYTSKGNLIVYTEKEMFEMMQRSDAILIACATANGPA